MGHDARLVPIAAAGWVVTWCVVSGVPFWAVGAALAAAALASVVPRRRPQLAAVVVMCAALACVGALRSERLASGALADWADVGVWAEADLVVTVEPRLFEARPTRPALAVATMQIRTVTARGARVEARLPVLVFATGQGARALAEVAPGSVVRVRGTVGRPDRGEPVTAVLRVRDPPVLVSEPGALDTGINHLRAALRASMAASPADQAALVPSLVVGDTAAIPGDLAEDFKRTSLTHLLAVSGANLTLLLAFLLVVVKWAGLRGWPVRIVAVLGVAAFVLICRSEPSVLRAAAMGTVALAALGAGRDRAKGIRHLCVAIIVLLLLDPWLARTWGFALSVAASAGILWWAGPWQQAMRSWAPGWLADAICIPLAAQLATQPLITAMSGQVSIIGVVANSAVGAFVGPATVLGLLAAVVGSAWVPLGVVFGWLAGWAVQPILWGARLGGSLPAAAWYLPTSAGAVAAVAVACVLLVAVVGIAVRARTGIACLVAASVLVASWRPQPPGWPGDWAVVFCSVGQGDATVLRAADRQAVLVDVGPDGAAAAGCLASLGVTRVPLLVLTHYHADHVGGLEAILARVEVGQVLVSELASPAATAAAIRQRLLGAGAAVRPAAPGEVLVVGAVTWTTVAAGAEADPARIIGDAGFAESAEENDSSVIGIAEVAGLRVLLAGDAEPDGQRRALRFADRAGIELAVDVLKLPHHGSSRQDEQFFARTRAALAVASAGKDNDYGHPSPKALALAGSLGMQVRRTDADGSIAARADGGGVAVRVGGP